MPAPGGKVGHAELLFGESLVMLADEFPDMRILSPKTIGGSPVAISVYVEDVDASFDAALEAGATSVRPLENQFTVIAPGSLRTPSDTAGASPPT